jgi:hypothetical protein
VVETTFGTFGTANCPASHPYATGGGAETFGTNAIQDSYPVGNPPSGWFGEAQIPGNINVWVICSK